MAQDKDWGIGKGVEANPRVAKIDIKFMNI